MYKENFSKNNCPKSNWFGQVCSSFELGSNKGEFEFVDWNALTKTLKKDIQEVIKSHFLKIKLLNRNYANIF